MTDKDDMFWTGLNAVAGEHGREICIASRKGSYIYGVNHAKSDQDFHMFVFPTVMELIRGKSYVGHVTNGDNGRNLEGTIHDVRRLPEFLRKMNPTIMEMVSPNALTSMYTYDMLHWWHGNRGRLLTGNRTAFVMSCAGTFNEKMRNLTKGTATTQCDVDKFGYDPKQAAHAHRYATLAMRYCRWVKGELYTSADDMADNLFYLCPASPNRRIFDLLKSGDMPLEDVKNYLEIIYDTVSDVCVEARSFENNGAVYDEFEELLAYTIERRIRSGE